MIEPHRKLSAKERAVWNRVAISWPDDYFNSADAILVTHYAHYCVAMDEALKAKDVNRVVLLGTAVLNYATKLRITVQSRVHPRTAGRAANRGRENEAADNRLLGGGVWSDLH